MKTVRPRQREFSPCGNVLQVHDLVDYVSDEAEIAGRGAAVYVLNGANCGKTVNTRAGNGVRYVLPQRINADEKNDVALFLRVSKPFGKVKYTVSSGDNVLGNRRAAESSTRRNGKDSAKAREISFGGGRNNRQSGGSKMTRDMTCIICPRGCALKDEINGDNITVTGQQLP